MHCVSNEVVKEKPTSVGFLTGINKNMKTYIITGCTSGLGLEMTLLLLARGDKVICMNRRKITKLNHPNCRQILGIDCTLIDAIQEFDGRVDTLILNASPNLSGYTLNEAESEIDEALDTIVKMHLKLFNVVKKYMHNKSTVVGVSSRLGSITREYTGANVHLERPQAYKIAKAAFNMLLNIIASESGFKCHVIHPGYLNTKMGGTDGTSPNVAAYNLIRYIDNPHRYCEFKNLETKEVIPW